MQNHWRQKSNHQHMMPQTFVAKFKHWLKVLNIHNIWCMSYLHMHNNNSKKWKEKVQIVNVGNDWDPLNLNDVKVETKLFTWKLIYHPKMIK
jgi:hypothetical protein